MSRHNEAQHLQAEETFFLLSRLMSGAFRSTMVYYYVVLSGQPHTESRCLPAHTFLLVAKYKAKPKIWPLHADFVINVSFITVFSLASSDCYN